MLEEKRPEKIGFRGKNDKPVKALANQLNRPGYQLIGLPFPIEVRLRSAKNTLSLPIAFPSQSRYLHSRSTSGRSPVEAIRMLLAFACFKNFALYQMDVKSAFLNSFINGKVYVEQPLGF